MNFVELSSKTLMNIDDVSHVHVLENAIHVFMKGTYPQARIPLDDAEYAVLKQHLLDNK